MGISDFSKSVDEGKEKHLPDINTGICSSTGELFVEILVGKETLHPSTAEHAIKTIILYGVTTADKLEQLTVFQLGDQNTVPFVRTTVKKDQYKELIATSYCNLHGLWENKKTL